MLRYIRRRFKRLLYDYRCIERALEILNLYIWKRFISSQTILSIIILVINIILFLNSLSIGYREY